MLAGRAPLGSAIGVPAAIEFQQKVPQTKLDDVVVRGTATATATAPSWWASVKSFDLLSTGLADPVEAAWRHALDDEFDVARDFVGFVARPGD